MATPPEYELEGRFISAADDEWIQRFSAGEEWWSHEVTDFLRSHALEHAVRGINQTILFSFPGYRDIVGFVTAAYSSLPLRLMPADLYTGITLPIQRVPAALIAYLAVARSYRRLGFGEEIHVQLLESINASWTAARWVYCECWEENEAGVAFWTNLGYEFLERKQRPRPDGNGQGWLRSQVLDRFALGPVPSGAETSP